MATVEQANAEPLVLCIEGEMTIYRAEELKQALLAAVERAAVLEIDLSAVTELDSAGVQLLMLAKESARARGAELRLAAHSPAVMEVFELIELGPYFGDPLVIPRRHSHAADRASHPIAGEARA